MSGNPDSGGQMSEAARRAYEAARRAFAEAPEVKAHAWRDTLAARASAQAQDGEGAAPSGPATAAAPRTLADPASSARVGAPACAGTPVRAEAPTRVGMSGTPVRAEAPARPGPSVRAENEDDDGYDPWSDRRPVDSFWEEDPWR